MKTNLCILCEKWLPCAVLSESREQKCTLVQAEKTSVPVLHFIAFVTFLNRKSVASHQDIGLNC